MHDLAALTAQKKSQIPRWTVNSLPDVGSWLCDLRLQAVVLLPLGTVYDSWQQRKVMLQTDMPTLTLNVSYSTSFQICVLLN